MIWVCWAVGFERDLRKRERREKGRGTEREREARRGRLVLSLKGRDKIVF